MAATIRQKCSVCFDPTNYHCIACEVPICNICSIFEEDEDNPNWKAGKCLAYCLKCKNYEGFRTEMQPTQTSSSSETTKTNNEDFVHKLKDILRSHPDRFADNIFYLLYGFNIKNFGNVINH